MSRAERIADLQFEEIMGSITLAQRQELARLQIEQITSEPERLGFRGCLGTHGHPQAITGPIAASGEIGRVS